MKCERCVKEFDKAGLRVVHSIRLCKKCLSEMFPAVAAGQKAARKATRSQLTKQHL